MNAYRFISRIRYLLFRADRCKHVICPSEAHCMECRNRILEGK
jgi:uncharacterized OB-fold protein